MVRPLSGRGPVDLDASVQHLQTPEGLAALRGFLVYLVTGETGHGRIPLLGGPMQPTNADRLAYDPHLLEGHEARAAARFDAFLGATGAHTGARGKP